MILLTTVVSFGLGVHAAHLEEGKWAVIKRNTSYNQGILDGWPEQAVLLEGDLKTDTNDTGRKYWKFKDGKSYTSVWADDLVEVQPKPNSPFSLEDEVRITADGKYKGQHGILRHWQSDNRGWQVSLGNELAFFAENMFETAYIPTRYDTLRNNSDIQSFFGWVSVFTAAASFVCHQYGSNFGAVLFGAATCVFWCISEPSLYPGTISCVKVLKNYVQEALKPKPDEAPASEDPNPSPAPVTPVQTSSQTQSEQEKPEEKNDSKVPAWLWVVLILTGVACIAMIVFFILRRRRQPVRPRRQGKRRRRRRREEPLSPCDYGEDRYDEHHEPERERTPGRTRKRVSFGN